MLYLVWFGVKYIDMCVSHYMENGVIHLVYFMTSLFQSNFRPGQ